jgi:molybdopterin synthase catalytic subunit
MVKSITITRVVSRNFIMDLTCSMQNFFGLNLTSYEKMVSKGMEQINEEIEEQNYKLDWYRYEITQLTNGAVSITLYGEVKDDI